MGSKRKHHYHSSSRQHDSHHRDHKRRRLSDEVSYHESDAPAAKNGSHTSQQLDGEGGWTKVSSKASKRDNKKEKQGRNGDDYPALRIYQNYQSEIRLKDIRDLGLYVLADEVAPKWTAVANSRSVKMVTVIMVPGLDQHLLRKAEEVSLEQQKLNVLTGDSASATVEETDNASNTCQVKTNVARHFVSQATASRSGELQPWLFRNVLQVKAPGDTKMSKVHSPLQAMLLSQESDQKQNKNANNFAADRTPITDFIHNADELREAGFPIHPTLFTAEVDAELEATRRVKAGQSFKDGWVDTKVSGSQPNVSTNTLDLISKGLSIYSLDCEMVQTSDDATSLARISLIKYPAGTIVIDRFVKPKLPITNYFTQYSGITPEKLENVTTSLEDIQQELLGILTPSSVLLGHSLDSDLNALKLTHPFLVDTSIIYPHPRGLPLRSSLKYLANKYLKREIQTGGANGHNSVEDAQAVLDLVKLKCEKGPKWGTIEANGEPIFRRLKRNGRTSAMVDYGTPERGFGKDATHTIGCQNDDEIVKGVIRAMKGDDYFDFEIPAGGVDYIWGRLRALEYARGWANGAAAQASQEAQQQDVAKTNGADDRDQSKLDLITNQTLNRIQQIYDALPAKSLLILFSGTDDVRPVMRLQAQQQKYRKEFKVKKWDELTIKWTDTEEQALKRACEDARKGWAVCAIK